MKCRRNRILLIYPLGKPMERVEFFESNGARIYGELTLPESPEKLPACLLIGGSFPQTRDGNLDNSQTDWFPTPLPERNLFRDQAKTGVWSK